METLVYLRKPLVVEAVKVTKDNIYDVAKWCAGDVRSSENAKVIEVNVLHPVNKEQMIANIGDWVLRSQHGFKIYNDRAFTRGFEQATTFNELPENIRTALKKIGRDSE